MYTKWGNIDMQLTCLGSILLARCSKHFVYFLITWFTFQPDLKEVSKVCLERLRALADQEASSESDDSFRKLQVETFGR